LFYVISGKYKGKKIPFNNSKFNNADITPQKIKGAVFSIIGEDLTDKSFLDLFSCSGQIGFEALSRGASNVIFNEKDRSRFLFIKKIMGTFLEFEKDKNNHSSVELYNLDYMQILKKISETKNQIDYIFLDPPYFFADKQNNFYIDLLTKIVNFNILSYDGLIIVQHRSKIVIEDDFDQLKKIKNKKYGSNNLTIFRRVI